MGRAGTVAGALALLAVGSAFGAAPASACISAECRTPDRNFGDYRLDFSRYDDGSGSVAQGVTPYGISDLDGDGVGEIATSLRAHYTPDGIRQVVVSFGNRSTDDPLNEDVAMHITGGAARGFEPVFSIPDANGDGIDEVATCTGKSLAVVFGRIDGGSVDLDALGSHGFELTDGTPYLSAFGPNAGCPAEPAGDVNGDGRGDIAFRTHGKPKVFFTPAGAAGGSFDVSGAGPRIAVIDVPDYDRQVLFSGDDDLDGDGQDDLVVFSHTADGFGHAVALMDLQPGATSGLDGVATGNHGFEVRYGPGDNSLYSTGFDGTVAGDVDGDGRPDLTLRAHDGNCSSVVAFSPPRGTYVDLGGGLLPGKAKCTQANIPEDAGDVDGDGRDDLVHWGTVYETGGVDLTQPLLWDWSRSGTRAAPISTEISSLKMIDDANGDGVRDELTLHSDTYPAQEQPDHWIVQTFLSRPFIHIDTEAPLLDSDGYVLRGSVADTPQNRARLGTSGQLPATVELRRDGQSFGFLYAGYYDVAANAFEFTRIPAGLPIPLFTDLFEQPERFTYRLSFQAGYGEPRARGDWTELSDAIEGPRKRKPNKITGTKRSDKLRGTKRVDWIQGRKGADRIIGRPKDDTIDGGEGRDVIAGSSGNDVIVGGPGRDVIKCGAGQDTVQVDPQDRTSGCEMKVDLSGVG